MLPSEESYKYEKYLLVRDTLIDTIYNLTEKYFAQVQSEFQEIISTFQPEEQKKLVNKLTGIYLRQLADFVEEIREKGKVISVISYQLSVISYQLSVISYQYLLVNQEA